MEEIGRLLRQARESRRLSLEEAEIETHIRGKYLEALESGSPENIPGDVYVKGFLRSYANFLGLDGPALVERYKELSGPKAPPAPPTHAPAEAPQFQVQAAAGQQTAPRPAPAPSPAFRPAVSPPVTARRTIPRVWIAVALVVVITAAIWLFPRVGRRSKPAAPPAPAAGAGQQPAPAPTPQPVASAPDTTPPPKPAVQVDKGKVAATADSYILPVTVSGAGNLALQLTATGDRCWVQVLADGQEVYQGTLYSGDSRQWQAGSRLQVRIGNPPALAATINGKVFSPVDGVEHPIWLNIDLKK